MKNFKLILNVSIIGISLGWMIGLSKSPVISSVISAVLAFVITVLIALSGVEAKNESSALKIAQVKVVFKKL